VQAAVGARLTCVPAALGVTKGRSLSSRDMAGSCCLLDWCAYTTGIAVCF